METLSPEILDDLRHGRALRERKLAVCSSGAHMDPVDRVEILAVLSHDPDEMISERALEALITNAQENFVKALQAFAGDIETMNREFTSRILSLLRDYVEQKITLSSHEEKSVATG